MSQITSFITSFIELYFIYTVLLFGWNHRFKVSLIALIYIYVCDRHTSVYIYYRHVILFAAISCGPWMMCWWFHVFRIFTSRLTREIKYCVRSCLWAMDTLVMLKVKERACPRITAYFAWPFPIRELFPCVFSHNVIASTIENDQTGYNSSCIVVVNSTTFLFTSHMIWKIPRKYDIFAVGMRSCHFGFLTSMLSTNIQPG